MTKNFTISMLFDAQARSIAFFTVSVWTALKVLIEKNTLLKMRALKSESSLLVNPAISVIVSSYIEIFTVVGYAYYNPTGTTSVCYP